MRPHHLFLAGVMSVVFGMGWVLAKATMSHFPPILLAGIRFGVTAGLLVWVAKPPAGRLRDVAVISLLAVSIPYSMSYTAMKDLDVSTAVLLAQLEAPVLILFGTMLLREWPSRRQVVGIAVAFAGVVLIAGDPQLRERYLAVVLALGSVGAWALGQVRIRRLGEVSGLRSVAWISLLATPQLFVLSVVFESGQIQAVVSAGPSTWLAIGYLGLVMTALGTGIWYHLIARYPAALVSPFLLLVPVVAILGGILVLGEELRSIQAVGGSLIVLGVAVVVTGRSARETTGRQTGT